jgi:2-oxo-4-hydroxy-4-carboxy-5-ureidoimidazoline decarboxylase
MNVPEDKQAFVARFGAVFEHSPWVAERAWERRPFASVDFLHQVMVQVAAQATMEERLALVRAHPELAGREAKEGALTAGSSGEQGRLGLTSLGKEEFLKMREINRAYRDKFGFPCIIALRLHQSRDSVVQEMQQRLRNSPEIELKNALQQIGHIARGRLDKLLGEG